MSKQSAVQRNRSVVTAAAKPKPKPRKPAPKKKETPLQQEERKLAEGDARYAIRLVMSKHFRMAKSPQVRQAEAKELAKRRDAAAQWNMRLTRLQHKELHAVALQAIPLPELAWTGMPDTMVRRGVPAPDERVPSPKDDDDIDGRSEGSSAAMPPPKPLTPTMFDQDGAVDVTANCDAVDELPDR